MSANFRRIALQKAARLLDLAVVSLTLVAAVAISSSYSTWPTLAEFLVLRIKVVNIVIFGGYLVVCSAILSSCGLYKSHRLSHWTRQAREIFLATSLITAVLYLSIATRNAIRNQRVSIPFLAFQLHGSLTGTRGRLSTLLLRPITWKKPP
jgi:hypothetical protein